MKIISERIAACDEDLKPCPFCGGLAYINTNESYEYFTVACDTTDCYCEENCDFKYSSPEVARDAWNTRV